LHRSANEHRLAQNARFRLDRDTPWWNGFRCTHTREWAVILIVQGCEAGTYLCNQHVHNPHVCYALVSGEKLLQLVSALCNTGRKSEGLANVRDLCGGERKRRGATNYQDVTARQRDRPPLPPPPSTPSGCASAIRMHRISRSTGREGGTLSTALHQLSPPR
jgi:hypothetical protein